MKFLIDTKDKSFKGNVKPVLSSFFMLATKDGWQKIFRFFPFPELMYFMIVSYGRIKPIDR